VTRPLAVEPLTGAHDTANFDCGQQELNGYLQRRALGDQKAGGSRTFVAHEDGRVIAYYSLAAGSVEHAEAPDRIKKGMGLYAIPVFLLARLAVDLQSQGADLGAAMLKDALTRCVRAAEEVAVRAVLVHAKDEDARGFYERFDFEASPTDPLHLFLLMKDLRAWIKV